MSSRGRLNSEQRQRTSTSHGTTIRPTSAVPVPFRQTQLRTFKVLLAADATHPGNPLTLDVIAKKAGVSDIIIRSGIGPANLDTTDAHEARYGYKCLLTHGMVKSAWNAEEGHRYYLTPLGKKRAEEARDAGLFTFGKKRVNQYTMKK